MTEAPIVEYPAHWKSRRVTLAHDWLTGMRGGENCLELLCAGFPDARIMTLIHGANAVSDTINNRQIDTSWLQRVPGIQQRYRNFLPLFPMAMRGLPPADGDLLISTSHCVAKAAPARPEVPHLSYCFTPMRYAWLFYDEYFGSSPAKALVLKPILAALRRWDQQTAPRVTRFIGISKHVQARIQRFYGRESDLVYPPVDTHFYTPGTEPREEFDLIVSALVPYKRVDLAVRAYTERGWNLRVVGVGGDLERLRSVAGPTVQLLEWQTRDAIHELYRRCQHLIFPGEEDFGIVPLEAQACGTPVIAFARGGALETVIANETGVFFETQSVPDLMDAVERARAIDWDRAHIRGHAEGFGMQAFIDGIDRSIRTHAHV